MVELFYQLYLCYTKVLIPKMWLILLLSWWDMHSPNLTQRGHFWTNKNFLWDWNTLNYWGITTSFFLSVFDRIKGCRPRHWLRFVGVCLLIAYVTETNSNILQASQYYNNTFSKYLQWQQTFWPIRKYFVRNCRRMIIYTAEYFPMIAFL